MFGKMLIGIIGVYKRFISPHMPNRCRFYPTCSDYAAHAIQKHGAVKGIFLSAKRLVKCNPLHPGGVDYVPENKREILLAVKEKS